jgi:NarL family two-component system response regulator LiaR
MSLDVLVVDDDDSMCRLLEVVLPLSTPGVEVVARAGDVEEGLEAARRTHPDLIILDHMLPKRTGAEAVGDFIKECPGSEVVLFSAYLDAPGAEGALRRAAREHHVKVVGKGSLDGIEKVVLTAALNRAVD